MLAKREIFRIAKLDSGCCIRLVKRTRGELKMLVVGDLRFYHVETTLDGGMRLSIRAIRPYDQERLVAHFERLSPHSQYRRFFGFRKAFTPQELQYMTDPNF